MGNTREQQLQHSIAPQPTTTILYPIQYNMGYIKKYFDYLSTNYIL